MFKAAALCAVLLAPVGIDPCLAGPDAERRDMLLYRLRHDCGSCHGMTMKGGLGPPLLPETLAATPDVTLADVIMNGIPGTPMPPWDIELTREETDWLVGKLKKGLSDEP